MPAMQPRQSVAGVLFLLVACSSLAMAANDYRYDRADFGQRIESVQGDVGVWWCEATWKVHPDRATPADAAPAAMLSAARNDREAVQVVLRPARELRKLTAVANDLRGPNGAVIPAKNVQVLRVYYHHIQTPTDRVATAGWWPDALPPLDEPIDLTAEKNQPLWVLTHVPEDAEGGDYAGELNLKAEGWAAVVPIKLHVWNFALPKQNHLETAFGLGPGRCLPYHRVKSDEDKRRVWEMYLQSFAEHRVSPYDPVPFDPIEMKFVLDANPPRAEFDFSAFDRAMSRVIKEHHFTNFRLSRLEGLKGSGKEGKRSIGSLMEGTPEYEAAFASQVRQLEQHFGDKGWEKMPYAYWTDEPKPEKYAFVQKGMEQIKNYAPGIQTLITTHMKDDSLRGPIDIWCPNTPNYKPETAKERQANGARYWWYLCTGPKAPFCTLFIDHPATEVRVWLWQTWQRNIVGILVWETVYWSAGPKQNPYEDTMAYAKMTESEPKKKWGNGDGRFLYPPLSAADRDNSKKPPAIQPPVSSIRWEMLREGIEDYEFLWLLRDLIGKNRGSLSEEQAKAYDALLEVPEEITGSMTRFTTDPRPIYLRRAAIAEAIERLAK